MMIKWRLFQYVSPNGRRAIEDWRKQLPVGSPRADLDTFLKVMVNSAKWEPPDIAFLKGDRYKGITELRWKSGRVPHRILGYQTGDHEYLMLIGCTHNARKYDPPDAMETARRRREEIQKGAASSNEYTLLTGE